MRPLLDALGTLRQHFPDDEEAMAIVNEEAEAVDDWIANSAADEDHETPDRHLGSIKPPHYSPHQRSIFDDVDA